MPFNNALLFIVSTNAIVVVAEISTFHIPQEFFVVRDNNELEVGLCLSSPYDSMEGLGKTTNIIAIQVGGRFIQCNELQTIVSRCNYLKHSFTHPTIDAEAFCKSKSDDDTG